MSRLPAMLACVFAVLVAAERVCASGLLEYRSEHYDVRTDLRRDAAEPFSRHMDVVFEEYARRFAHFGRRDDRPMLLYLFNTRQAYLNFLKPYGIDGANTGGIFFVRGPIRALATWTADRPRSVTFAVLQHEGFHQFAYKHVGPGLPVWVNEGVAQYFEDGIVVDGRLQVGMRNARRVESIKRALASRSVLDFDDMLAMDPEQWTRTLAADASRSSLLYDQAWSMVLFLITSANGRYKQAFEKYLLAVSADKPSMEAYRLAFATDSTAEFRRKWEAFVGALEPDGLNTAVTRMEFLAQGLEFLKGRGEKMPRDIEQLRGTLAAIGFVVLRQEHGLVRQFTADDQALYAFTRSNGSVGRFRLLEPSRDDLPPRITALGLRPEPTLTWSRDAIGRLTSDIEYR